MCTVLTVQFVLHVDGREFGYFHWTIFCGIKATNSTFFYFGVQS
ncbi:unnamed protein product, partial [marine sediment metagenome]